MRHILNFLSECSIQEIPLELLIPDKVTDRRSGKEIVAASVAVSGLDPTLPFLVVESPKKDGTFVVVDGRKRLLAAESQGYKTANCAVLCLSLKKARELAKIVNSLTQQAVSRFPLGWLLVQQLEEAREAKTESGRKRFTFSKEKKNLIIALTGSSNRTLERAVTPLRNLYWKKKNRFKTDSVLKTLEAFKDKYPRSALALFLEGEISVHAFAKNWESEIFTPKKNSPHLKIEPPTEAKTKEKTKSNKASENPSPYPEEEQKSGIVSPVEETVRDYFSRLKELLCSISARSLITKEFSDQVRQFGQQYPEEVTNLLLLSRYLAKYFRPCGELSGSRQKSKRSKYTNPNQTQILFE